LVYAAACHGDRRGMTFTPVPVRPAVRDVQGFHLELHEGQDICVLRLEGSFRQSTAHLSLGTVEMLSRRPECSLLVDSSLLGEIDQVGLEVLVGLRDRIEEAGGKMVVYAATGPVADALQHSPLHH
jgi:anti-anti-sigma factor